MAKVAPMGQIQAHDALVGVQQCGIDLRLGKEGIDLRLGKEGIDLRLGKEGVRMLSSRSRDVLGNCWIKS